jgi:hypothetical protein
LPRAGSSLGFWAYVLKFPGPGCWLWFGGTVPCGYGLFHVAGTRKMVQVHRHAYEELVGPIPVGLQIDHQCHNADATCRGGVTCLHRRCVRPDHMTPATNRENYLRGHHPNAAIHRQREAA